MIAKNKRHFIKTWEQEADDFVSLFHATQDIETIAKVEKAIENLKSLIRKVADEGWPDE